MKSAKLFLKFQLVIFLFFCSIVESTAQPANQLINVLVAPQHTDWKYKVNEEIKFSVSVLKAGNPIKDITVKYEIGMEQMPPLKTGTLILKNGQQEINGGKVAVPGFLRCAITVEVDGTSYRNIGTAAIEPEKIEPTTNMPADFLDFWNGARKESVKNPLDTKMTLIPSKCTEKVNVYEVSIRNGRIFGIVCIPTKPGKYPAVLEVPGAGIRSYGGDIETAEAGIISVEIGINGIPVTMDKSVYANLAAGPLNDYWYTNLDDRDRYYYKRVYLGCLKANDFIFSLPQFNGETLAVSGGSQGGALSIITAALDSRVKYLYSFYPALCDLTGYFSGRAGGWPHMFASYNAFNNKKDKIETSKYYDVVNFARLLKIPGVYSFGYNDEVCPPTSMFAAYNTITAPKQLFIYENTGHLTYPEQSKKVHGLMVNELLKQADKYNK
jgi:cephalosporin-C deacetylase